MGISESTCTSPLSAVLPGVSVVVETPTGVWTLSVKFVSSPPIVTPSIVTRLIGAKPVTVTVAADELVGAKVVLAVMLTTVVSDAVGSLPSAVMVTFTIGLIEK